jgi:uncharacterized protein (DUF697 family)
MSPNPIANNPVLTQAAAGLVLWLAARYGLRIDDEQALKIAGAAFLVLAPFVRQLVRPVAKDEGPLTDEEMARARALLAVQHDAAQVERAVEVPPAGNTLRSNRPPVSP